MSTYDKIAWLPIAGGLTGVGLVLSYLAMRSRGVRAGLRGAAWSLLPIAAYLTGSIEMFWKMGTAIGNFATGFVFSTKVWSGIAVAGVSALLFVATGGFRRRRVRKAKSKDEVGSATAPTGTLPASQGQLANRPGHAAATTELSTGLSAPPAPAPSRRRHAAARASPPSKKTTTCATSRKSSAAAASANLTSRPHRLTPFPAISLCPPVDIPSVDRPSADRSVVQFSACSPDTWTFCRRPLRSFAIPPFAASPFRPLPFCLSNTPPLGLSTARPVGFSAVDRFAAAPFCPSFSPLRPSASFTLKPATPKPHITIYHEIS